MAADAGRARRLRVIQKRAKWYPCAVCGDYTTNNQNGEAVGLCRPCEEKESEL